MRIEKKENKTIEILEDVKIVQNDHDIILEKGDRVQVLKEGSEKFGVLVRGRNMVDAYKKAVADAIYEYGHDLYNGTISTTYDFVDVTSSSPNLDYNSREFRDWEEKLLQSDIAHSGQALGIDLGNGEFLFVGWGAT